MNDVESTLNVTDVAAKLEEISLAKPVETEAEGISTHGNEHIENENKLESKEQKTTHDLSVIEISKSEDKEGELYSPVTFCEGSEDINGTVLYGKAAVLDEAPKSKQESQKPTGNSTEEALQVVEKGLEFI
jgi:hypothetical protein